MIFCRTFFVSQYRNISQGNRSVFQKISGIEENYGYESWGWVEYHELPSEVFCLTVPKKIVQESFSVSFDFGHQNNLCLTGLCHDTFRKFYVSQCRKKLYGNL